ncbi:MAG: hypothetical protein UR20_C0033G0007 [Candidatus Woesebacteria bacterium GW2011_GWE2_31_6]|nr:MAG: hypothetical protein UR20_C0033G0007 [Candidatus Woesebacteria bacterium GW2011_GWE2_31_6]
MPLKMIDVDQKLWTEFKRKCFAHDISMKDKLNELIKEYVRV